MLRGLTLESAGYPVVKRGSFKCSDPLLTTIWEMCQRTQAVNMEDAYIDCPGRERGLYARDMLIQYLINLVAFGDHALMRRCLEVFGQSSDPEGKMRGVYPSDMAYTIDSFCFDLVESFWVYYQNSGDRLLLETYWPSILRNLRWFDERADQAPDGLVDFDRPRPDGAGETPVGVPRRGAISCVWNCFYLIALKAAHKWQRSSMTKSRLKRCAIESKGSSDPSTPISGTKRKDSISTISIPQTHLVQASLLALRAGIVSPDTMPVLRQKLRQTLNSVFVNGFDPSQGAHFGPEFAFYLFDGLYRAGLEETAENLMREGWSWMLNHGLKTCAEHFSLSSSHCHAWSGSPAYYLSREVLGIKFPQLPNTNILEIDIRSHHACGPREPILIRSARSTSNGKEKRTASRSSTVRLKVSMCGWWTAEKKSRPNLL